MSSDRDIIDEDLPPDLYAIRLQGPWKFAWLDRDDLPQSQRAGTIRLPATAGEVAASQTGTLQLTRRFQTPTNLDPEEQVLLLLPRGCRPRVAELNGGLLEFSRQIEGFVAARLTDQLLPSNQLTLRTKIGPGVGEGLDLSEPILLGIMPDADGSWWEELPLAADFR
jgi:hypothetical protein